MSSTRKPKTIDPDKVDPSVYFYDEVYDDIKREQESDRSREKQSSGRDRQKGSKYIDGLKETAELRKTEKELRKFKRYTKDREEAEAEGNLAQEDVYITDSYRRRLAEIKQIEKDKLQRLEREQDRSMNFMKKQSKTAKVYSVSDSREHRSDKKASPDRCDDEPSAVSEKRARSRSPEVDSTRGTATKKRPKTIEERREYLRKVLRKRTVGKVYDEALQRYMQRKASS